MGHLLIRPDLRGSVVPTGVGGDSIGAAVTSGDCSVGWDGISSVLSGCGLGGKLVACFAWGGPLGLNTGSEHKLSAWLGDGSVVANGVALATLKLGEWRQRR